MKRFYLFCFCSLFLFGNAAALKYWVGPLNGNWNDASNWSASSDGPGGAGVPGATDSVVFIINASVNLNVSPVVDAMYILAGNVTLYTSVNTEFTVLKYLQVNGTLTDSTSADVAFNFIFNPATNATGEIRGNWIFSGGMPVTGVGGAGLTAESGTNVSVVANENGTGFGSITFRRNTGRVVSSASTLRFSHYTFFKLEDNMNAFIPDATWARDSLVGTVFVRASTILITGKLGVLQHLGTPLYGYFIVDLPRLPANASLNLPDGTVIDTDLEIFNTNNHTLTLLAQTGPLSRVHVHIGSLSDQSIRSIHRGSLKILGSTTKVALATGTASATNTSYRLQLSLDYEQTGGNFSLQDYNDALDTSTLAIWRNINQTGGTFITNSTTTNPEAGFIVEMNGPVRFLAPGSTGQIGQSINMSSGTIDNGTNLVTLRLLNSSTTFFETFARAPEGVQLLSPLTVGKLELLEGTINTSSSNVLTVINPGSREALKADTTGKSYVNGPLRRMTNSAEPYLFPTGKSNFPPLNTTYGQSERYMHFDSVEITPVTTVPSVYQAEYFITGHPDSQNIPLPLKGISKVEHWDISKISGSDATVTLFLNSQVSGATSTDGIVVAHYVNGQWVAENGTILVPGDTSSGSVESKPLSTFSPFTFGYLFAPGGSLPVHLISLDVKKENGGAKLDWKVAEVVSRFEVLRSSDGNNFSQIGTVNGTPGKQAYSFVDSKLNPGTAYYRLRSIETDGKASLSKVVVLLNGGRTAEMSSMAPTLVRNTANLSVSSSKTGQMELVVTDMKGHTWKKFRLSLSSGNSQHKLDFGDLSAGVYHITGYINGEKTSTIRFIRQ